MSGPEFGLTDRQKEALIERQAADLTRLRDINADLLAALKLMRRHPVNEKSRNAAWNAIAKAEGLKP